MSEHERDAGMDCLFSGQDMKVVNVKFFRGSRDVITPDEFRAEIHSAVLQKRSKATVALNNPPRSTHPKVDVRAFVSDM